DLPVSGIVRLENGNPAYLAEVALRREDGWESGPSSADSGGAFVVRGVPPGDYAVLVDGVERAQVRAGERVEVVAPE
ncbi:MAG TPA: carboxypeptidase-like regulatory domain-containing protein, partial [Planctomycetota bacterium]|nr:carboxypeptidase-like regulatory domain-containing protein [Planctomycetota bacterium]